MAKREAEPSQIQAFFTDLPCDVQLLVSDCLHVFDRFRLSLVSSHFRRLIPEPAAVIWRVNQWCRPCGSLDYLHSCHPPDVCPIAGSCIVRSTYLRHHVRQVVYPARLMYNQRRNQFVIRTATKLSFNWYPRMKRDIETDLFELTPSGNVVCYRKNVLKDLVIVHHVGFSPLAADCV